MTLAEAKTRLALWEAADAAVASGTELEIGDKRIRRASPSEIQKAITFWERKIASMEWAAAETPTTQTIRTRFL